MAINAAKRAAAAWRRIQDKPASIVFTVPRSINGAGLVTPESTLAAQTVRVELDNRPMPAESAAGLTPKMRAVIFGIKDHATLGTTDMKEGYTFVMGNDLYRIEDVIDTIGERQGLALATG